MSLPKSLTTVTTLSKTLALVIFILMPVVGFLLGMQYQENMTPVVDVPIVRKPTPTPTPPITDMTNWETYTNEKYKFEFKYLSSSDSSLSKNTIGEDYLKISGILFSTNSFMIINPESSINACQGMCPVINEKSNYKTSTVTFDKYVATPHEDEPFNGGIPEEIFLETKISPNRIAQFIFSINNRADVISTKQRDTLIDQILSTFKFIGV